MVSRFMTSSFLLIHTRSSEFGFLFYPLVYLRVWRYNLIVECFLKRLSTSFSHQASVFKIHASVHVQLSPMTFCSARREALSQPTIGKPLKCAVYPSEAKRLFHYFDVRNSWPLRWTLTAISHHQQHFSLLWFSLSHWRNSERFSKCSRFSTSMMSLSGSP